MIKLMSAAAAAAVLCAGLVSSHRAMAQDWNDHWNDHYNDNRHQAYTGIVPIGEAGARWGNQCWVDTSAGAYFGYWAPCALAKNARH